MKTLYLLRHAKSSWDESGLEDHDRPLNARGIENATQMGRYMNKKSYAPTLVLCSSARRTVETLERLAPYLPSDHRVREERGLYLASPQQVLSIIKQADDKAESLLVVAHSPGTEGCALLLARAVGAREERALRASIEEKFPTAALAALELPASHWRDVAPGTGTLTDFARPRDL
jgi:phosphohistidine phosphatase